MSKPFTYEIDERSLRVQLKSMEAAPKEELWAKFETYAESHRLPQSTSRFRNLELNLNRNVVLPVVFGLIICVFSFLLFNFISIKRPNNQQSQVTAANSMTPQPSGKDENKATVAAADKQSELVLQTPVPEQKQCLEEPPKTQEQPVQQTPENILASSTEPSKKISSEQPPAPEQQPVPQKRKRHRHHVDEQVSGIRPSLVADEEVVEVIQN